MCTSGVTMPIVFVGINDSLDELRDSELELEMVQSDPRIFMISYLAMDLGLSNHFLKYATCKGYDESAMYVC